MFPDVSMHIWQADYDAAPHLGSARTLSDLFASFFRFLVPLLHHVFHATEVDRAKRVSPVRLLCPGLPHPYPTSQKCLSAHDVPVSIM